MFSYISLSEAKKSSEWGRQRQLKVALETENIGKFLKTFTQQHSWDFVTNQMRKDKEEEEQGNILMKFLFHKRNAYELSIYLSSFLLIYNLHIRKCIDKCSSR